MLVQPAAGSELGTLRAVALIVGICMSLLAAPSRAQAKADMQTLIRETQRISRVPGDANGEEMILVWWLPVQFWEQSLESNPAIAKQAAQRFRSTLDPYTMLIVLNVQIGPFGGMTYKSEEAVRASVTLKDAQNVSYAPLADSQISPDAKSLLAMMKPLLANALGPLGQNFNYLLFKSKTKDGRPLADPMSEGSFTAVVASQEFKFRLPLGSLMPAKYDPTTHEQFPGNYLYSPFTGTKLVTRPSGDAQNVPLETSTGEPAQPSASPVK